MVRLPYPGGDLWNIVVHMGIGQVVSRPLAVLAIGASLLLSGCASTSQSDLEKAKAAGASEEAAKQSASAQQEAQAKLAAEVQKLKDQLAAKTPTSTASPASPASPAQPAQPAQPAGTSTSCGGTVSAGPNTTCAFALNVAAEYFTQGGGTRTVLVYSPVTNQDYSMSCVAGVPTVCRGGNNAVVYIR
jgi:hypothetical protein